MMNKFFKVHHYIKNIKENVASFSLKGKVGIWWEDLKNVKGIGEEEFSWDEFEGHFRRKYLFESYYDNKPKEFYKLIMGYMFDEDYISKFLELLQYVPYLKEKKEEVQIFISRLP